MKKNYNKYSNTFPAAGLFLSAGGVAIFYLLPLAISLKYAFIENTVEMNFVGLQNFIELLGNKFFLLGLKNTIIFMLFAIPLSMLTSLMLGLALKSLVRFENLLSVLFLVPFVLPAATTVQYWNQIFADKGIINTTLACLGLQGPSWLSSKYTMGVMIFIYIWKNIGYNAVIFLAGLHTIPEAYYPCASLLGANAWQRFRYITIVYLTPTFFIVFILSFVNSFKIFKEVYLMQGEYPHESIYLLQHFVNKTLLSLHYHRLVSAVYLLTVLIVTAVIIIFALEEYFSRNLRDM